MYWGGFQEQLIATQHQILPSVVKISRYSYAVIGKVSTSPLRYTHVSSTDKDGKKWENSEFKRSAEFHDMTTLQKNVFGK